LHPSKSGHCLPGRTSLAIDLASVSNLHYLDKSGGVINVVDYAIVALPDAIALGFA
jgi:hypothetical protein